MRIKFKLCVVFLLAILPIVVHALGMGSLELKSKLNEPFEARIPLLSVKANDLDSLNVNLADANAFSRAGLDRPFVLGKLKFALGRSTNNTPDYIRVFSSQPIREPFLSLLIEVNWSNGRLYREYSVLLDPISYNPSAKIITFKQKIQKEKEVSVSKAAMSSDDVGHNVVYADDFEKELDSSSVYSSKAAMSSDDVRHNAVYADDFEKELDSSSVSSNLSPKIDYSSSDYGPTSKFDTLWSIAKAMRPDKSISVNQMMLALFKANQDAFYQNNINNLKIGQSLRMPSESDINTLSFTQALTEVKSQHAAWNKAKKGSSVEQEQIISKTKSSATQINNKTTTEKKMKLIDDFTKITPELKLVSANDFGNTINAVGNSSNGNDLILAQESIQILTQENLELKDQIQGLDSVINELERLLIIQDDQLAAFQKMAATSKLKDPVVQEITVAPHDGNIISMSPGIFSNLLVIAIVALSLVGVFIFIRKKPIKKIDINGNSEWDKSSQTADIDETDKDARGEIIDNNIAKLAEENPISNEDFKDVEDLNDLIKREKEEQVAENNLDINVEKNDFDLDVNEEQLDDDEINEEAEKNPIDPDTYFDQPKDNVEKLDDDPLQEVNTYLAFEQFYQAEELVRNAIKQEPNNSEYYLKLLEVFYNSGNKKEYEIIAKTLQDKTTGQDEHWEMAVAMWNEMSPNRALFEGSDEEHEEDEQNPTFVNLTTDNKAVKKNDDNELDPAIGNLNETEEAPLESNEVDFDISGVSEEAPSGDTTNEDALQITQPEEISSININAEADKQIEIAAKLDLAKAYVELGDKDSAKALLDEIINSGNDEQKQQAQDLLAQK